MSGSASKKPVAPQKPIVPPTPHVQSPDRFNKALRFVLLNEDGKEWDKDDGCYTNNPKDPGGRTMWGVVQTEYEGFYGRKLSEEEIKAMPREVALKIYMRNFWLPIRGDSYKNDSAAIAIMDTAVNKGLGGCMVILTDVLHNHYEQRYSQDMVRDVDSIDEQLFLDSMCNATIRYINARIARFPNMEWARKGWTNRANRLRNINK